MINDMEELKIVKTFLINENGKEEEIKGLDIMPILRDGEKIKIYLQ